MKQIIEEEIIKEIKKILYSKKEVFLAYIFGSRVAGFAAKKSDIDLAVFVKNKNKISERQILMLLMDLPIPYSLHVSCVDLDSPPIFLYQIIKNGVCIYERDKGDKVKTEARILDIYYDNQHLRNIYHSYLRKSFKERTYGY